MKNDSIGLWEKTSKNNNIYYSGKAEINGKKYIINLFKVDKGENTKRPDYNLIIKEVEEKKERKESTMDDETFANFGNGIDIPDEDLAF